MTIFDDIGKGFESMGHDISKGAKSVGESVFVKPVNNIKKGVSDTGNWIAGAGESIFHETKSDVGALFNFADKQIGTVSGILDNNIIWIVVGIGLVVVLLK